MSTVKAFTEHQRSWSEENLLRVQQMDRIKELEGIVAEQKGELAKFEQCKAEKAALEEKIQELRVKLYDAERHNEKMSIRRSGVRKISGGVTPKSQRKPSGTKGLIHSAPKGAIASRKSSTTSPRMSGNSARQAEAARKAREAEWQKTMGPALKLLTEEGGGDAKSGAKGGEGGKTKEANENGDDSGKGKKGESPPSPEATVENTDEGPIYEFDLKGLAKAVPGILLKTALEAEQQFAVADVNRNGVLDIKELAKALDSMESHPAGAADDGALRKAVSDLGLDPDGEFDFLDCIHIINALSGGGAGRGGGANGGARRDSVSPDVHHGPDAPRHKSRRSLMARRKSVASHDDRSGGATTSSACAIS